MLLRDVPGVFSMSMSMSSLISYKTNVIFDIIINHGREILC